MGKAVGVRNYQRKDGDGLTADQNIKGCRSHVILKPTVIALLPLFLTIPVACLLAAYALRRMSAWRKSWILLIGSVITFFGQFWFLWSYDAAMWISIAIWVGSSIAAGILLFFVYQPSYRQFIPDEPRKDTSRFEITGLLAGLITGGSSGFFLLFLLAALLSIVADYLFSTLTPVNFSLETMRQGFVLCGFFGVFCGTTLGGITGGRFRSDSAVSLFRLVTGFLIASFWLILVTYTLVVIPAYQITRTFSEQATTSGFIVMGWLISIVFVVSSSLIIARSGNGRSLLARSTIVGLAALGLGLSFSIYSSLIPYDFFLLGKNMENRVKLELATRCYEKSLIRQSNDRIQSFLKYRMSLLQHKNGNRDTAKEGFQAVVSKYNADRDLVKKASSFLRNLEKANPSSKRKVIAGVETDTEHKINYCAPNSYALNYRYWGKDISPKEVGRLFIKGDAGTAILDAIYHTRNLGLEAYVSSPLTIDEVKELIDHDIPVLVFIPRHVFVIFGYDEILQTFISYDTASKELWIEYPMEEFKKEWVFQFNMTSIILPENHMEKVPEDIRKKYVTATPAIMQYLLAYHHAGKLPLTIEHLRQSIQLNPDLFYVAIRAVTTLPNTADDLLPMIQTEKIIEKTSEFLNIDPDRNLFTQNFCDFLLRLDRPDEARIFLKNLEDRWELNSSLQNRLAVCEYLSGHTEESVQRLRRINDSIAYPLDYLGGYACQSLGNLESAQYFYRDFLVYIFDRYEDEIPGSYEGYFDAGAAEFLMNQSVSGNQDIRVPFRNYLGYAPRDLPIVLSLGLNLAESADEDDKHDAAVLLRRVLALTNDPIQSEIAEKALAELQ